MLAERLKSERIQVDGFLEAIELYFDRGWTDGLPVVPPSERMIWEFLEYAGLKPGRVLGEIQERNRHITAEKLAINAVMAGCKKEYMPVLIAIVEAITDTAFKFNHLASLGSPWPMIIVNGPVVEDLQFNYGMWLLGPGYRANATIGRALSLLLWNCAEARPGGIQRGTWGNPCRWASLCVAENPEEFGWEPLHIQLGFASDTSTVTVLSTYPGPVEPNCLQMEPEAILTSLADSIATSDFIRGVYPVLICPPYVEVFVKAGWSKSDVRDWLFQNTKRSVADLKQRGRWGTMTSRFDGFGGTKQEARPGDEDKYAYVFKASEMDEYLFDDSNLLRKSDVYLVVAGGDAGTRVCWLMPYGFSSEPVTKVIQWPVVG